MIVRRMDTLGHIDRLLVQYNTGMYCSRPGYARDKGLGQDEGREGETLTLTLEGGGPEGERR